jgi:hypothetical protein
MVVGDGGTLCTVVESGFMVVYPFAFFLAFPELILKVFP